MTSTDIEQVCMNVFGSATLGRWWLHSDIRKRVLKDPRVKAYLKEMRVDNPELYQQAIQVIDRKLSALHGACNPATGERLYIGFFERGARAGWAGYRSEHRWMHASDTALVEACQRSR